MPVSLIISSPSTFDKLPRLLFKYQNCCEIQLLQKKCTGYCRQKNTRDGYDIKVMVNLINRRN
jgi:hypothetical protein